MVAKNASSERGHHARDVDVRDRLRAAGVRRVHRIERPEAREQQGAEREAEQRADRGDDAHLDEVLA